MLICGKRVAIASRKSNPGLFRPERMWEIPARAGAGDAERLRKLRLRDVLRVQELLKAFVHRVILRCYKSNESKVIMQVRK